ncbi:hypothetical protein ACLOJK_026997 [Asimina triloba]
MGPGGGHGFVCDEEAGKEKASSEKGTLIDRGGVAREEGTDLQAATTPGIPPGTMSKPPTEPDNGIFVAVKGSSSMEPNPSPESLFGLLLFEGAPQVINLEGEGDTSLQHKQVNLSNLREAKLLSDCKTARLEAV